MKTLIEKISVFGEKSYANKIKGNAISNTSSSAMRANPNMVGTESIRTKILGKLYNKPVTPVNYRYKTEKPSATLNYIGK